MSHLLALVVLVVGCAVVAYAVRRDFGAKKAQVRRQAQMKQTDAQFDEAQLLRFADDDWLDIEKPQDDLWQSLRRTQPLKASPSAQARDDADPGAS